MSIKTLLFAVGALALAACSEPTEPTTGDAEAQALLTLDPPVIALTETVIAFTSHRDGNPEIYIIRRST